MGNRFLLVLVVVLFLCVCPALGLIEFKDGLTHNIDYEIEDEIWVDYETPEMYTTINWLDGASTWDELLVYESGRINVYGGEGWVLASFDSSLINMTDGLVWVLESFDSSRVNISGGLVCDYIFSDDSSQVNISSGTIDKLFSHHSSRVGISGGSINWLFSSDSGQVDITGGLINRELWPHNQSMIRIFGSDFTVDGTPFGYGVLTSILGGEPRDESLRHLTGTLLSGELINTDFRIGHDARIVLIPEPTSAVLMIVGVSILRLRCRK